MHAPVAPAPPVTARDGVVARPRTGPVTPWPGRLALLAILVLAAVLVAWNLGREGLSNPYYAAAVRSMLDDPVAFLFGGFDAGRYITLDKPPLGYQLQAVSAAVLGFNGVALLLPQLVATVLSVGLVYRLVRPAWGALAGLVAAQALAVTPVAVAVARNTTVDATLVAVLLAGALALQRGVRTGRARWLALALALVGVGFDLKMLQAYLVLPAFGAAWLAAAPGPVAGRLKALVLAAVPLAVVSFAWPAVVALWPVDVRPWIGGSATNSLFDLALGYNGLERLATGRPWADIGTAGPLRFLEPALAGQVGWLLPMAGLGAALGAATAWRRGSADPVDADDGDVDGDTDADRDAGRRRARVASLVLWGAWLLTGLVFFSVARFWHRHYLVVLAPAVAALAGIGVGLAWRAITRPGAAGWLAPIAVLATGVLAAFTGAHATDLRWLAEPALLAGLVLGAAMGAARGVGRVAPGRTGVLGRRLAAGLLGLAVVAAFVPPAAWSAWTVAGANPIDVTLPTGGPPIAGLGFGPIADDGGGDSGGRVFDPSPNAARDAYLLGHRGDATWIVAVEGGLEAAPLILATGQPVMAIGGFLGRDPAIALDGFRWLVRQGRIRFASAGAKLSDLNGDPPPANPTASDIVLDWVVATCAKVDGFETLYDCAGRG